MKNRVFKAIVAVVAALAVLAAGFVGGYLTGRLTRKDAASTFDWIVRTVQSYYYEEIPEDELLRAVMNGGISSALDSYSAYYTAEEYLGVLASNGGSKAGVGVSYEFVPQGANEQGAGVLIARVLGNSPAYYSGLKSGTFVLGARSQSGEVAFEQKEDFSAFVQSMAEGEAFTLLTDRGEYEMCAAQYTASYCSMYTAEKSFECVYGESGLQVLIGDEGEERLPQGAALLRLDQFYGNAAGELALLMEQFNAENCTSLILDLRGNGGGYVDVMLDISGIFVGQRQISGNVAVSAVFKNGQTINYGIRKVSSAEKCFPENATLSILADNGTASASEALIGVLVSYNIADYSDVYISDFSQNYLDFSSTASKNRRTYGKGIMQSTYTNPATGDALKLTTAKIYWPNGSCIHGSGLSPELGCRTLATSWDVVYGDPQLTAAIGAIYG